MRRRAIYFRANNVRAVLKMYEDHTPDATAQKSTMQFSKENCAALRTCYMRDLMAQSLPRRKRNKKGNKGNRVRLKDCGEWKLWGRRPLTIEKQAVALSGERS